VLCLAYPPPAGAPPQTAARVCPRDGAGIRWLQGESRGTGPRLALSLPRRSPFLDRARGGAGVTGHAAGMRSPLLVAAAILSCTTLAACGGGSKTTTTTVAAATAATAASSSSSSSSVTTLQDRYTQVVKDTSPSIVQIETSEGLGSGIVLDDKGDVVTNAHVVGNAHSFVVTTASGHRYQAKLVGRFAQGDLAVVRASGAKLSPARFADSGKLEVGDIVLAIGNPLGLRSSVTNGIVSALGRTVSEPGGASLPNTIQTSAAINPGNSGGALVDLDGRVVGIPTLAAVDQQLGGGAAPGIGFAIPSNTARDIAAQLVKSGRVTNSHRAFLGVSIVAVQGAQQGAIVAAVEPGGPADKAGIRRGDRITKLGDTPTPTPQALAQAVAALKPGQRVKVAVTHADGSSDTIQVTLGTLPSRP
jgi:S1-C subfamily serine protease